MPHILLVKDTQIVADALRETLELEGWHVETCADGRAALRLIESEGHFDLFLLDNELPNVSGLELTRRARRVAHREGTPVVVISASECGRDARRAGADAFIRKPQDVWRMVEIIARLLNASVAEGD
jgi:CheY-like chemotaxis protein